MKDPAAQINEWAEFLDTPPMVKRNSDLRRDDLRYPHVPNGYNLQSSRMVFRSLLTAVRTMQFMTAHVDQSPSIDAVSYSVLSRTAMVGAAHAVWLLEDDDADERLRHGLLLSKENVRQFKSFADRAETYKKTVHPDMAIKAKEMRTAGNVEIAAIDRQLAELGTSLTAGFDDTNLLFQAAKLLDDGSGNDWRKPITDAWRIASGFAHALSWQFEVGYNLPPDEFVNEAIAAPFLLTDVAFDLLELRRE